MKNERQEKLEPSFKPVWEVQVCLYEWVIHIVCADGSGVTIRRNIQWANKIQIQTEPSSDSTVDFKIPDAQNKSTNVTATTTDTPSVRTSGCIHEPPARLHDRIVGSLTPDYNPLQSKRIC